VKQTKSDFALTQEKSKNRKDLLQKRRVFFDDLRADQHALCFSAVPTPLKAMIDIGASIGGYWPNISEADPRMILHWAADQTYDIALPYFADRDSPMEFRHWNSLDPLETGPFAIQQPINSAMKIVPELLLIPMIGFTRPGIRLGQGGGHYDRYCAEHPDIRRVGIAWSMQECDSLPYEPHDMPLDAILTEREWIVCNMGRLYAE
jgi:5-formyltetrahydrofolate cyclo-ligase